MVFIMGSAILAAATAFSTAPFLHFEEADDPYNTAQCWNPTATNMCEDFANPQWVGEPYNYWAVKCYACYNYGGGPPPCDPHWCPQRFPNYPEPQDGGYWCSSGDRNVCWGSCSGDPNSHSTCPAGYRYDYKVTYNKHCWFHGSAPLCKNCNDDPTSDLCKY